MKTVWHWNNIFKAAAFFLIAAVAAVSISYYSQMSWPAALAFGSVCGWVAMMVVMILGWDLFHFEFEDFKIIPPHGNDRH